MLSPPQRARFRLKADGRIVAVESDGRERPVAENAARDDSDPAAYARNIRAATRLTQAEFAARIGVPIETVRNWEQGKRAPRGPARALLKVLDKAPELAFAVLKQR
ncbi:MAG: helix-turn-helix domain-containing protein [Pseudorhodoplanes sp.]